VKLPNEKKKKNRLKRRKTARAKEKKPSAARCGSKSPAVCRGRHSHTRATLFEYARPKKSSRFGRQKEASELRIQGGRRPKRRRNPQRGFGVGSGLKKRSIPTATSFTPSGQGATARVVPIKGGEPQNVSENQGISRSKAGKKLRSSVTRRISQSTQ